MTFAMDPSIGLWACPTQPAPGGGSDSVVTSATIARRVVGRGLKTLREQADVTAASACEALEIAPQTLWRIETGQRGPKLKRLYIAALCAFYSVPEEVTAALIALAHEVGNPVWWREFDDLVPDDIELLLGLEQHAHRITTVHPSLIPPPLRTADYQRALSGAQFPGQDTERWLEFGEQRHTRLLDSTTVAAVLCETALDPVADTGQDPGMLAEQIQHLITLGDRVSIRIIPRNATWRGLIPGAFELLEFPAHPVKVLTEPPMVHMPGHTTAQYHNRPIDITRCRRTLATIHRKALDQDASRRLLLDISGEHPRPENP